MQTQSGSPRPPLFDTALLRERRDRAERGGFATGAGVLHAAASGIVLDRVDDVTRRFEHAVVIGAGDGSLAAGLHERGIAASIHELSPLRAARTGARVLEDPDVLPLAPGCADLAVSLLEMHWANDPVGHLIQLRRALRPDGLLLAVAYGGQTLGGLRAALGTAEAEVTGGLSPRVAPMGEIRDLGALLQRAGLSMPVADAERFALSYTDPIALMHDLRAMGETNVLADRHKVPMRRAVLGRACTLLNAEAGPDGRITETFEMIVLTGWAPGPDQPQPKRPGSATARLADALGTDERPLPDKAPRG